MAIQNNLLRDKEKYNELRIIMSTFVEFLSQLSQRQFIGPSKNKS